ncbi:MAG: hypothetical protein JWM00_712 [Candidatus Saccharibacteria bacterium]|nr:hypothetical protein [Candidatus Saccharibacteria bacterium]
MTSETEYVRDTNQLRDEVISDLESLLGFAKELLESASYKHYVKAKTVIRYNTFSALYQRADAILALTRANQGNASNILIRSMWETLAEYDFINLEVSNINLKIRLASESKQQLGTWTDVQRLRAAYPNAETWKRTISDEAITRTIARRRAELEKFSESHPTIRLDSYKSLLARLKKIDDSNLAKNPDYKTLTQFDYRGVYSILSGDTHSTVLGNMNNSRIEPKAYLEIRLDAPIYETVRAAQTAYKFLVAFLQIVNRTQKLKKGVELKIFRDIDKSHDKKYIELQEKYGF